MPLKINVGLSKKLGLPNYGSVGASCNVEIEADASLLQNDLDGFFARIRAAYAACRQAVHDELAQHKPAASETAVRPSGNGTARGSASASDSGAGSHDSAANSSGCGDDVDSDGPQNGNGSHRASEKQMDYIRQLARQIKGLGVRRLESLAEAMFSKPVAELSSLDASGLIDCLKGIRLGQIDLDAALDGAVYEH